MPENSGLFIVIEGSDGSGKGTQFKLLKERLRAVGYDVEVFDFPRYDQPSSYFVQRYLNGAYGTAVKMSPYTSSLFFALDRFEAAPDIRKALSEGKIVLSNRYVGSNMAHQGSMIEGSVEQRSFFIWEDNLEFQLLGIPRPTINIFLRVPAEISYELIKRKAPRSYTKKTHDELEGDIEHLKKSVATYDTLCRLFPKDFKAIDCTSGGELLNIPAINNLIWDEIKHMLPEKPPHPGHSVVVQLDETSKPEEPVKEVAEPVKTPESTISPIVSLQDGEKINLKIDSLSLLVSHLLKTSPGISVKLSHPWEITKGRRQYYVPEELDDKQAENFRNRIDKIAANHRNLHRTLINVLGEQKIAANKNKLDAVELNHLAFGTLRPLVPMAALVSAEISGSTSAVENAVVRLLQNRSREARELGLKLQKACLDKYPKEFKKSEVISKRNLSEPSSIGQTIAKLASERLPQNLSDSGEPVKLVEARPRNELDLLADIIYPHSDLPREDIEREIENWTYEQKAEAMQTALSEGTASELLDMVLYRWDIISDWPSLNRLLHVGLPHDLQLQPPSPRYGYGMPELIEEYALDDEYMESFDISLGLFSELQEVSDAAAPYATLSGHKVRWQAGTELPLLVRYNNIMGTMPLLMAMAEKISEVHPLLAELLKPVRPKVQPQAAKKPTAKKPPAKNTKNRRRSGKSNKS